MPISKLVILAISLTIISCSSNNYLLIDKKLLTEFNESRLKKDNNFYFALSEQLVKSADKLINTKPFSVVHKSIMPPSGDKHDYLSYAIYYWPNEKEDQAQWEYVDGKVNKLSLEISDHKTYYDFLDAVKTLSLAYKFTGKEKYAKKSAELISVWFFNDSTKMNPNFRYAQGIPGKSDGTPSGIIDSRGLLWVIDSANLLTDSGNWDNADEAKLMQWMSEYLNWLTTNEFAKKEGLAENNHGTFYDLQVLALSKYLGNDSLAINSIKSIQVKRIAKQIEPNGKQPKEVIRSTGYFYSLFNLAALVEAAHLAADYNIDLWNYRSENSGSIIDAIEFLAGFIEHDKEWSFSNDGINYRYLLPILLKSRGHLSTETQRLIPIIESKIDWIKVYDLFYFI